MGDAGMRVLLSASRDLVTAVRALTVAASISDVDAPTMHKATQLVKRASKMRAARVRTTGRREHLDRGAIARLRGGEPWGVFTHNPMGIPLRISVSGAEATATVMTTALFEGPPGILHGAVHHDPRRTRLTECDRNQSENNLSPWPPPYRRGDHRSCRHPVKLR